MALTLALFQAAMNESATQATEGGDPILYIIFGVVALGTLAVIGLRFFQNLWETVTAPTASLGHIGQSNNFFVSLAVVFFSGLIAAIILLAQRAQIIGAFSDFVVSWTDRIAGSGVNPLHAPDMATTKAAYLLDNFTYYFDQILFLPVALVLIWIIIGFFAWIATKMFGAQATLGSFLGSLAYPVLFYNIGFGLAGLTLVSIVGMGFGGVPAFGALGIIGLILLLYGLVLYLIGIARGADLTAGRVIGVLIVLLIVLGGIGYGIYATVSPKVLELESEIKNYDPAR